MYLIDYRRLAAQLALIALFSLTCYRLVAARVCQAGKTTDNNVLNVASRWLTIYKTLTFPCDGTLKKWEFYISDPDPSGQLYLDVWRQVPDSADSYFLVGSTYIHRMKKGKQLNTLQHAERITVKAGDMVGIHYSRKGDYAAVPIFTEQISGPFSPAELSDVITAELYDDDLRTLMATAGRVTIAPVIAELALPAVIGFTEESGSTCNIGPALLPATTQNLRDPGRWMVICPQVQFPCSGQIMYWEFLSLRVDALPMFLAVWRPSRQPSARYELVGMTQVIVNKTGLVRITPRGYDKFWVEAGDSYGIFYSNGALLEDSGTIPYADQAQLNGFSYGDIADCISIPILASTVEEQLTNIGSIDTSIGQPVRRAYALRAFLSGKKDDTCGSVPSISNATASVSFSGRDSRIGDVIQYTCLPGFELDGSPIVSCSSSAAWSDTPSCKLISSQKPCSVGAPKISQSLRGGVRPGTWLNLCLVPGVSSKCYGSIAAWELFSIAQGGNSTVYVSVWRKIGYSSFKMIGSNPVTVSKYGLVTERIPEKERIIIRAGDYIGIYYESPDDEPVINYASEKSLIDFKVEDLWDCVSMPIYQNDINQAMATEHRVVTNKAEPVKRLFNLKARILGTRTCGAAPIVTNATQAKSSFVGRSSAGDSVTYQCMPGLYLQAGELRVTCQTSGQWTKFPICTAPPECSAGPKNLPLLNTLKIAKPGNWLNICPSNTFSCDGKINVWELYSTRNDDRMVYLSVWRRSGPAAATLVGFETWNATRTGIVRIESPDGIQVRAGDFVGVFYDDDDKYGLVPFADDKHIVEGVPSQELQVCFAYPIWADEVLSMRSFSFDGQRASRAKRLHLAKAYVTVDPHQAAANYNLRSGRLNGEPSRMVGYCSDIPVVHNGYPAIVDSSQPYSNRPASGDKVVFKCRVGFIMVGNSTVICQKDGSWSSLPMCQELPSCFLGLENLENTISQNMGSIRAPGGWMNLCPTAKFRCGGKITHWTFLALAKSNATVYLAAFRKLDDSRIQLVGYNALRSYTAGLVEYEVPLDQQVQVAQGDFLGVFYSDVKASGALPYVDSESVSIPGSTLGPEHLAECFSMPMNSVTLFNTLLVNKFLSPRYYVTTRRMYLSKAYVKAEASCGPSPLVADASSSASFENRLSTPGDTVIYKCAADLVLRGSALVQCLDSGKWSEMPECI